MLAGLAENNELWKISIITVIIKVKFYDFMKDCMIFMTFNLSFKKEDYCVSSEAIFQHLTTCNLHAIQPFRRSVFN